MVLNRCIKIRGKRYYLETKYGTYSKALSKALEERHKGRHYHIIPVEEGIFPITEYELYLTTPRE